MKTILILTAIAAAFTVSGAVLTTSSEAHTAMINDNNDTQTMTHKKHKINEHKKHQKHMMKTMAY
jgi:hypothetical protein